MARRAVWQRHSRQQPPVVLEYGEFYSSLGKDDQKEPMVSDFMLALKDLANEDVSLTHELLVRLSGPTRSECTAYYSTFERISDQRRREAMERMVSYAEESFQLDYADIFRHYLADRDAVVRRHAIEGLWEDDRPDLVKPLLERLSSDSDTAVRVAAAMSLGKFVYLSECEELDEECTVLLRQGLERAIHDSQEDIEVIRRSIEAISFITDDEIRRIIDRAYAHDNSLMRLSAVVAMGRSADRFWTETVLAELESRSPAMRCEAARASGELQLRRAVPTLVRLVEDFDGDVCSMAIWALGQIGGKLARSALEVCAQSDDEETCLSAQEALEEADFADGAMDLMLFDPEDVEVVEMDAADDEDDLEDVEDDSEEWPDDFIELG